MKQKEENNKFLWLLFSNDSKITKINFMKNCCMSQSYFFCPIFGRFFTYNWNWYKKINGNKKWHNKRKIARGTKKKFSGIVCRCYGVVWWSNCIGYIKIIIQVISIVWKSMWFLSVWNYGSSNFSHGLKFQLENFLAFYIGMFCTAGLCE